MPELPEVEIVVRELREQITGKTLRDLNVLWHKTVVNRYPVLPKGKTVQSVGRRGKYILIRLEQSVLVVHLRMTGQLLFFEAEPLVTDAHVRAIVRFEDGSLLHFKDVRKFGRIYHVRHENEVMKNVGVDAFSPQMDPGCFEHMLRKRAMGLKAFLLNQHYMAGMGNIYTDESLFKAGLYPGRSTDSLSREDSARLFHIIRDVLQQAIDNMGSTISDYRDTKGNKGGNQEYFTVYGREGQPCKRCGSIIKKIKMAGRGTHYCPQCQK